MINLFVHSTQNQLNRASVSAQEWLADPLVLSALAVALGD
jgi:hypothetical protein